MRGRHGGRRGKEEERIRLRAFLGEVRSGSGLDAMRMRWTNGCGFGGPTTADLNPLEKVTEQRAHAC